MQKNTQHIWIQIGHCIDVYSWPVCIFFSKYDVKLKLEFKIFLKITYKIEWKTILLYSISLKNDDISPNISKRLVIIFECKVNVIASIIFACFLFLENRVENDTFKSFTYSKTKLHPVQLLIIASLWIKYDPTDYTWRLTRYQPWN